MRRDGRKTLWVSAATLALALAVASHLLLQDAAPPLVRAAGEAAFAEGGAEAARPAAGDSLAQLETRAEAAIEACGPKAYDEQTACYETFLLSTLRTAGVETAMATLKAIGARDRQVESDGHVYAHAIGIQAYQLAPDVSATFGRCSEIYQSGCQHGVIQAHFESLAAPDSQAVNELCRPWSGEDADMWLRFQCVHGLGHGLTMFHGHDLPAALRGCDLLADGWDRDACYGGAFMENIVNATTSHHPASRLEVGAAAGARAGDAHAGHSAGPHPAASGWKALDPEDLYHPCSVLDERYWPACYAMQTSIILHFNGYDFAAGARVCDGAPASMRRTCYQSLGRDVSSYTVQDHGEAIRLCSLGTPGYQPWCYVGVVKNFVDLTARAEDGFAFCRAVPGETNKLKCHEAVGEEIGILESGAAERAALCEGSEPGYVDACRYGARLTPTAPPGLVLGD